MSEDIALAEAVGTFIDLGLSVKVPPRYVIRNVLPTGIVFLSGPPKSKKSTLLYLLCAAVAGKKHKALPPDMMVVDRPGRVVGLSAEASAGEIRFILENGAKLPKIDADGSFLVAEAPWDWRLDDEDALERLLGWLDSLQPRVFFLDPLRDFHSLEEKDDGSMNRLLRPIQQWAVKHDATFVVLHHTAKKAKGDTSNYGALDMRGTGALFAIADGVLMLTPRPDEVVHIDATIKRGEKWEKTIHLGVWGKRSDVSISQNAKRLLRHLRQSDEHLSFEELSKLLKVSKTSLVLAGRELETQGLATREGRRLVAV